MNGISKPKIEDTTRPAGKMAVAERGHLLRTFGWRKRTVTIALAALMCAGSAATLEGDTIVPTYEPAGTQVPDAAALCASATACYVGMETFDSWNGSLPFDTD